MAKGSVRKKGKKWYYRFYIEDESGNRVQKEYPGTESKSETEALLRRAMEDYEEKRFVAKAENITVGDMLDMWVEEELKPGTLSNGTVMAYQGTVRRIKQHPLGKRKLKTVTADHLQAFIDFMSYGGTNSDGTTSPPMSRGYMLQFSAVLQNSFRFAVFPKRLITFNPMQYVKLRGRKPEADIFSEDMGDTAAVPTISYEQFRALEGFLKKKDNPALLPVQIAYYTGLRIGEVCALTWKDINLDEQYLTVRRSIRYNGRGTRRRSGPPSGRKSALWTSATRWRQSSKRPRENRARTACAMASSTVSTTIPRSERKTVSIMRSTPCRGRRMRRRGTRRFPLSASGLMGR